MNYHAITALQAITPLATHSLFRAGHVDANNSPVDRFINNTNAINVIYLPGGVVLSAELSNLVLLGYMSAVESYFRALIRGLINIDDHTRIIAEPLPLSFGAALHHDPKLLPEALLEDVSFAGASAISRTMDDIIGIKGKQPIEVTRIIGEYRKICEIRHCCVHRFGRLGANNAIRLGLQAHSTVLEKPFAPTKDALQEIADLLRSFVKTLNNYIFRSVLDRTAAIGAYDERIVHGEWAWDFRRDRARFLRYYELFCSKSDVPASPAALELYQSFRSSVTEFRTRKAAKLGTQRPRQPPL